LSEPLTQTQDSLVDNAGLAEGRSAGLAEAQASVLKSRLEIARNLKEMGMAEDRIAAATGLDSAEIAKL
jgi:predicted transposase YdaD